MDSASFRISNSMLRDWEEICPLVWKSRHVDETLAWKESQPMRWGTHFETLVIGSGVKGKTVTLTPEEKKSVVLKRIEKQAKDCRSYLRKLGGKIVGKQVYLDADVVDSDGQTIPIMGGLDIRYQFKDGTIAIIDLKLTGDVDNDFGKFAWGKPETMDPSQLAQYGLIEFAKTGVWPITQYWVFDSGPKMKQKLINVNFPDHVRFQHIERVSKAYNEITIAWEMDMWMPHNTYENCSVCPLRENCIHRRLMPEIIEIDAWSPQI